MRAPLAGVLLSGVGEHEGSQAGPQREESGQELGEGKGRLGGDRRGAGGRNAISFRVCTRSRREMLLEASRNAKA